MSALNIPQETLIQVTEQTASQADLSIISLIISSDFVGKTVILLLLAASVFSWAIIISKFLKFRDVKTRMKAFESVFWSGQVLDDLFKSIKHKADNPLAAIFIAAMDEFYRKSETNDARDIVLIGRKDRINQSMNLAGGKSLEQMESKIGFLATISSSSVFVGLFGTVWGIIHSFQSIAASKNTSLAIVAPGIAEALVATAIGLFVAIPAGIFYNYLVSEIDYMSYKINNFSGELGRILSRNIDAVG